MHRQVPIHYHGRLRINPGYLNRWLICWIVCAQTVTKERSKSDTSQKSTLMKLSRDWRSPNMYTCQ